MAVGSGNVRGSAYSGKSYSMPKSYGFMGQTKVSTGGFIGGMAGRETTSKLGFSSDITFSPSLILASKGIMDAAAAKDLKGPLWSAINNIIIPSLEKHFNSEGRPVKRDKLSGHTVKMRKEKGFAAGPILQRTGKLKKTALAKARWSVDGNRGSAIYGNFPKTMRYANTMQGGIGGKKFDAYSQAAHIPARPFAVMQEQDFDDITKLFETHMLSKLEKRVPKGR